MGKLATTFAALALSASVTATEVDNTIPDGTIYQSNNPNSMQMHKRVNDLPDDATHIFVPEEQYHDKLGERKWITENQFQRGLTYLAFIGLYEGPIEYSHGAVTQFERMMDGFIDHFVVSDAKPEEYQGDIYAKYDMLRVHALENQDFVEHVLQQSAEYAALEKKSDFRGDVKILDGYLGLMGQDYNVGTKNDGQRIQAIREFSEGRTALSFLQNQDWDKTQLLSDGQNELLKNGLALLGYGQDTQNSLPAFYKDQNIAIDPPQSNLEALSILHSHITKDGKAFDRVEDVLYDFGTVEEKIGYAQAVLTFYGEHTEIDDKRWAHTMLNLAQLGRRMGDDLEVAIEDDPPRIYSSAAHIFWDSVRWSNENAGAATQLPSINPVLDTTNVLNQPQAAQQDLVGGEEMRWSSLSKQQQELFESRYINLPVSELEEIMPKDTDERVKTQQGRDELFYNYYFEQGADGKYAPRFQVLKDLRDDMRDMYEVQIRGMIDDGIRNLEAKQNPSTWDIECLNHYRNFDSEKIEDLANKTASRSMVQVVSGHLMDPARKEYIGDETAQMYIYLLDREGGNNWQKVNGNMILKAEDFRAGVKVINQRDYMNFRAEGGDPQGPVPYEQEAVKMKEAELDKAIDQDDSLKINTQTGMPRLQASITQSYAFDNGMS